MKIDEVRGTLFARKIDAFACTETWLTERHDDSSIRINGFRCFRDDRKDRRGGGVAVWLRSFIPAVREEINPPDEIECVILVLRSCRLIILTIYIPPNAATKEYRKINDFIISSLDDILKKFPDFDVFLCGDFNHFDVTDVCSSFTLLNLHNKPTYGSAELDYMLISEDLGSLYSVSTCSPFDRSKVPHMSLLASTKPVNKFSNSLRITRKVYDLRRSHVESFVSLVKTVDWAFVDNLTIGLDAKCETFQCILESAAATTIPVSYVRCNDLKRKPWITPFIINLINRRWSAFRSRNFAMYNHYKEKVRKEISKSKSSWCKRTQNRDMWKTVNAHLGSKSQDPIASLLSDYKDVDLAVEDINTALTSVFLPKKVDTLNSQRPHLINAKEKWEVEISPELVMKHIKKFPSFKASPDLPTLLYKAASIFISEPLCKLYRQSIAEKTVPKIWKTASIAPVPKSTAPSLNELRPISLLPFSSKVFERIVLNSVKDKFLASYGNDQYGFRPRSSTQCALIALHENLTTYLDNEQTCGAVVIAYDYSKAFDKLRHDLIIDRMIECDFPQDFILWINSYLSDRFQFTKIGTVMSSCAPVTSGVPQGSILGPYLYAMTTGSYCSQNPNCHVIKFADDTTLCFPIFKSSPNVHILTEHQHLLNWSKSMDLTINAAKCKCLCIPKGRQTLDVKIMDVKRCEELKILGVWFNSKGNWSRHAVEVTKIASRRLFALRTLRPHITAANLKLVYFSLVRSVLEYCGALFCKMSRANSNKLDKIQRRFHRMMCGSDYQCECLPSLSDRRSNQTMKLLTAIMHSEHILHRYLPLRSSSGRFVLPYRRTSRRSDSFFLFACELFNFQFVR